MLVGDQVSMAGGSSNAAQRTPQAPVVKTLDKLPVRGKPAPRPAARLPYSKIAATPEPDPAKMIPIDEPEGQGNGFADF